MRKFIYFDFASHKRVDPKTQGSRSELGQPLDPFENISADAASAKGQLSQLASAVTNAALERKLIQQLENEKVGTMEIEIAAITLNRNHQTGDGIILQKIPCQ